MKNSQNICIFGNGQRWNEAINQITKEDFVIGVDVAAFYLLELGIAPDVAIGDFDSVTPSQMKTINEDSKEIITCKPHPKYQTDMEQAIDYAIELNPQSINLFWSTGGRFDQTLANFYLLEKLAQKNIQGNIVDQQNRIRIINHRVTLIPSTYKYVSLLPITASAEVSLTGFLYDVTHQKIKRGQTLGISNEIKASQARIEVHQGSVAIIQSRDGIIGATGGVA